jgi:hypothetical protein
VLGFPIRTSTDQCLVDSSPWLIAVAHVLHRFLAPRHPPLALCSLEEIYRCSCLLCSSQGAPSRRHIGSRLESRPPDHGGGLKDLTPSKRKRRQRQPSESAKGGEPTTIAERSTDTTVHQLGTVPTRVTQRPPTVESQLLRKEVIQPHLPVRLPCYDFTPIADPTFDGSLPNGLGHRLRVLQTLMV